ncbi:hypothetical protein HDV06_003920 [Boothiomyces sp. JEL0866]|nr:hypothetical protein HDV06_003920 [Boothiomyces sp. JEL0866]
MECGQKYFQEAMICPACETNLTQRDDVVITDLNPTEDYKSSVLSGLRPEEAAYQEIVQRGLNEKCNDYERKMQLLIREANQELAGLLKEREMERRRHHELTEQFAEKSRQFQKLQSMYDKLKRKIPLGKTDSTAQADGSLGSGFQKESNDSEQKFPFLQKKNDLRSIFSQKSSSQLKSQNKSPSPIRQQFNARNSTPNPLQNRRFNLFNKDANSISSMNKSRGF